MLIGEVADRTGVPASTIRYYERLGLIEAPRRMSGRRQFDVAAVFALDFIKMTQAVGFSLEETRNLLAAYAKDRGRTGTWVGLAEKKKAEVGERMRELAQMDRMLKALLSCSCESLAECVEWAKAETHGRK